MRVDKDPNQTGVYIFRETKLEKENRELREAVQELQEREKIRNKDFKPKSDLRRSK